MVVDGQASGEYSHLTHTHHLFPFLPIRAPAVAQIEPAICSSHDSTRLQAGTGSQNSVDAVLGSTAAFIPSSFVGCFGLRETDRQPQLPK